MRRSDLAWRAAALLSAVCISGAYAMARQWVLASILFALVVLFLGTKRPALGARPALFLATSTTFAAAGMHLQLSVPLLVMGTAAALAAWDLAHLADRMSLAATAEHGSLLQRSHVPSLVAAIASGLGLAFLASIVRLQLSFGAVSLLALILVLAIAGIPRAIKAGAGRP